MTTEEKRGEASKDKKKDRRSRYRQLDKLQSILRVKFHDKQLLNPLSCTPLIYK